jgi:hypothetical protein
MFVELNQSVMASLFDSILNTTTSLWGFPGPNGCVSAVPCGLRVVLGFLTWFRDCKFLIKCHFISLSSCNLLYWKVLICFVSRYLKCCEMYDSFEKTKWVEKEAIKFLWDGDGHEESCENIIHFLAWLLADFMQSNREFLNQDLF